MILLEGSNKENLKMNKDKQRLVMNVLIHYTKNKINNKKILIKNMLREQKMQHKLPGKNLNKGRKVKVLI